MTAVIWQLKTTELNALRAASIHQRMLCWSSVARSTLKVVPRVLMLACATTQVLQGDMDAVIADRDQWRQQAKDARDEAAGAAQKIAAQDGELSTARSRLEALQA